MSPDGPRIRRVTREDAAAVAALSDQLGYPVAAEAIAARLERLLGRDDQLVLAAVADDGELAGWIHAAEQDLVEAERRCEILGLVVDGRRRRGGIGRGLVAEAERWAASRGLRQMSVRSNVAREESHPFYEAQGYGRVKTQQVYRKPIGG
ncbi:MAG TPA: GNAT family N-acetyltransferase, partial [Gemmatimonadales bacterium]